MTTRDPNDGSAWGQVDDVLLDYIAGRGSLGPRWYGARGLDGKRVWFCRICQFELGRERSDRPLTAATREALVEHADHHRKEYDTDYHHAIRAALIAGARELADDIWTELQREQANEGREPSAPTGAQTARHRSGSGRP